MKHNTIAVTGTVREFIDEARRRAMLKIKHNQRRAIASDGTVYQHVGEGSNHEIWRLQGQIFAGHEHWGDPMYEPDAKFAAILSSRIRP